MAVQWRRSTIRFPPSTAPRPSGPRPRPGRSSSWRAPSRPRSSTGRSRSRRCAVRGTPASYRSRSIKAATFGGGRVRRACLAKALEELRREIRVPVLIMLFPEIRVGARMEASTANHHLKESRGGVQRRPTNTTLKAWQSRAATANTKMETSLKNLCTCVDPGCHFDNCDAFEDTSAMKKN